MSEIVRVIDVTPVGVTATRAQIRIERDPVTEFVTLMTTERSPLAETIVVLSNHDRISLIYALGGTP